MLKFIISRLIYGIAALWITATLTFILMHNLPGEPFSSSKIVPTSIMKNLRIKYGLDKPIMEQYGIYMKNLIKGDLGLSMVYSNRSVNGMITRNLPVTADLALKALILTVFIGIPLGFISALNRRTWIDRSGMFVAMLGVSIPGFILGTLIQYGVCFQLSNYLQSLTGSDLRLLPITGWGTFRHTIAPSITLSLGGAAMTARLTRSSILRVLDEDYIVGAKAKGLKQGQIIRKHVVKNAMIPVVSIVGTIVTTVFLGSFVVENIFSVPGLGQYFVSSVQSKDYTMIMGLAMFAVFITVTANTLTDIAYGLMDPRIKVAGWRR